MNHCDDYEQPRASYPVLSPPIKEKRDCAHLFKDATSFSSPDTLHICVWCGERRVKVIAKYR